MQGSADTELRNKHAGNPSPSPSTCKI